MLKRSRRHSLFAWLSVLIAVAMCAVAPAQAQIYRGAWDPLYGSPFTQTEFGFDLTWSGEAFIYVPPGCPPPGGTGEGLSCTGAELQISTVKLAKDGFPDGPPAPSYLDFYWNSPSTGPGITDLLFADGKITAFRSFLSEWVTDPLLTGWDFALLFVRNGTGWPEEWQDPIGALPVDYNGPVLYSRFWHQFDICDGDICGYYEYGRNDPINRPQFREGGFVPVPEPSVLALIAGALLGTGWARRRRLG